MSEPTPQEIYDMVDAYADGVLDGARREAFERRLEHDERLRELLERQSLIDASLRRIYAPPGNGRVRAIMRTLPLAAAAQPRRRSRRWVLLASPLAAAAVLALGVLSWQWLGADGDLTGLQYLGLGEVYRRSVGSGFTAMFECRSDREFATSFYHRLGQGLLVRRPDNVQWVGISRGRILTQRTHYVLLRVDGKPVIVFVDRAEQDPARPPVVEPPLHVFRRQVNQLVLYEVSDSETPLALDLFFEPEMPEEWKNDVPGW